MHRQEGTRILYVEHGVDAKAGCAPRCDFGTSPLHNRFVEGCEHLSPGSPELPLSSLLENSRGGAKVVRRRRDLRGRKKLGSHQCHQRDELFVGLLRGGNTDLSRRFHSVAAEFMLRARRARAESQPEDTPNLS